MTKYRIYADGTICHEDCFEDLDNSLPYYDDYRLVEIDEDLEDYLISI
jgi:hypothetical protein